MAEAEDVCICFGVTFFIWNCHLNALRFNYRLTLCEPASLGLQPIFGNPKGADTKCQPSIRGRATHWPVKVAR